MASSSSSSSSSSSTKLALAFVMATWLLFFRGDHSEEEEAESSSSSSSSSSSGKRGQALVSGLGFSFIATLGNTAASMLRKQLSSTGVSPAEQVGLATLIQGFVALVYCQTSGVDLARAVRDRSFVAPAVASSTLNALTKTLETRAYATTDVSLCAPFLAFDPVFQFLLPAIFAPVLCSTFGWLCGEAAQTFPASHPAAVGSIAAGAFLLKQTASSSSSSKDDDGATSKKDDRPSSGRRKKNTTALGRPPPRVVVHPAELRDLQRDVPPRQGGRPRRGLEDGLLHLRPLRHGHGGLRIRQAHQKNPPQVSQPPRPRPPPQRLHRRGPLPPQHVRGLRPRLPRLRHRHQARRRPPLLRLRLRHLLQRVPHGPLPPHRRHRLRRRRPLPLMNE
mmetsp:Transcript_13548/g.44150  ORF Transcript_13548/g.44150 Transcript_13548/m.44150 type:complete len:391 (-) Transcript_13548:134-1306(-)